jgi:hypothetical protein
MKYYAYLMLHGYVGLGRSKKVADGVFRIGFQ